MERRKIKVDVVEVAMFVNCDVCDVCEVLSFNFQRPCNIISQSRRYAAIRNPEIDNGPFEIWNSATFCFSSRRHSVRTSNCATSIAEKSAERSLDSWSVSAPNCGQ